jgi:replicative DNA helicase
MTATRYEFDASFQGKIAALVLRDAAFNARTQGLISPEYFESQAQGVLVDIVQEYYANYRRVPSLPIVIKVIKDKIAGKIIRDDMGDALKEAIKKAAKEDISDRDYIVDEVSSFARHQAIQNALFNSVDLVEERKFDEIAKIMRRAIDVGANAAVAGYDYWDEIDLRTRTRADVASGLVKPKGISTGFRELDDVLYHHGWGRKELSVILGAAKGGKTTALGEFSIRATLTPSALPAAEGRGHNVLYLTNEVSTEILAERMDSNVSEVQMRELGVKIKEIEAKVKAMKTRAGKLMIHEFPMGSLKASDIRRMIAHYAASGLLFDMITVDYADIMAPEVYSTETRENSRTIFVDLRALAFQPTAPGGEFPAILTATQSNREGAKATVAKMTDVAEDFNKARIADLLISVNSTDEERALGEARLYFAASRNQEGNFTLRIKQDLKRMKFLSKVLGRE